MPARSIDTARISFGLVTIPVKIYSTSQPSEELHFHLIHEGCGERMKQQYVCPKHGDVARSDIVKGFQLSKQSFVELSKEELKALEAVASDDIALAEFVPIAAVDPLFVERSYYVGPDKGGERAYRLFRDSLEDAGIAGIASYAARGKQYVVMLRPYEDGLVMHQLRYPDEVKPWSEVPIAKLPKAKPSELKLAGQIIHSLEHATFDPAQYTDEVKGRVRKLIASKAKSGELVVPETAEAPAPITDLMAALKASLGKQAPNGKRAERPAAAAERAAARRPHRRRAATRRSKHPAAARPAARRSARRAAAHR